jgi:hypothetical protein
MIAAIDARALGEQVGHLAHDELRRVEDAVTLVLDLVDGTSRAPDRRAG